ncbi:MAG: squalene-hopene/tetraprenyl-beta-curcumene cyclase, partial [Candidatus Eremiobacteraeota bacterium]|nr:squalene-hopene/tetraprenyl-beta-curcumene cyclase [Candidatus Eremiobacteraeota bacterium]
GLAVRALADAGVRRDDPRLVSAASWLLDKQIVARYGDWSVKNRTGKPGGWAFEFENAWYPDVDDTAVVAMALAAVDHPDAARVRGAIARASEWVATMQCKTGGWGAFDVDNDKEWLNRIPYGDLKAMVDPSTADVTARVLEMVARCGLGGSDSACSGLGESDTTRFSLGGFDAARFDRALTFLLNEQERDGAWFGRWGVNYVYGTSGALAALGPAHRASMTAAPSRASSAQLRAIDEAVIRGAVWLKSVQQDDGGWGETTDTYKDPALRGTGPATASQTAWALIGLLACAERLPQIADAFAASIERGVGYLLRAQRADGSWDEPEFTGTGFPLHFYLNYHQYRLHFPLTALGRYAASRERTASSTS